MCAQTSAICSDKPKKTALMAKRTQAKMNHGFMTPSFLFSMREPVASYLYDRVEFSNQLPC